MPELKEILEERGSQYGSYLDAIDFRIKVLKEMDILYNEIPARGGGIPQPLKTMIEDVLHKLARVAVRPWHVDSWRDIQGYSQLILDYLKEESEKG